MKRHTLPRVRQAFAVCLLLAAASTCHAAGEISTMAETPSIEPAPSAAHEPQIASGDSTRMWLGQQVSGQQASRHRQALSGPVMTKVYQRYLNSFGGDGHADSSESSGLAGKLESAMSKLK